MNLARILPVMACALVVGCGPADVSGEASLTDDALTGCGNALAISSASASTEQSGNEASHAVDGNLATRWSGEGKGASLTAKLGAKSGLCAVQVAWFQGDARKSHFVISLSSDGKSFTTAVAKDSSGTTAGLETYTLPSGASAQYVRVTVNDNTVNDWASIDELKIYGAVTGRVKPSASNTGVPAGTTLHRLDGDQDINAAWLAAHPTGLPAGAGAGVIEDQDIYGRVHIEVPNITLRRSRIRGSQKSAGSGVSLVWVTAGSAVKDQRATVVIEDCEIAPTYPNNTADGLFGYNFTALRNNIHHTVDGMGLLYFTHIEGNYVHDLTYFDHDSDHTNGTHNDCIQMHPITSGPLAGGHGGSNVVVGNFLDAFIAQDAGTPGTQAKIQFGVPGQGWDHQAMSAFMVNANFENTVTDNWIEGGYYPVNAGDSENAHGNMGTWERNQFDRMRYDNPGAYYKNGTGSFNVTPRYTLVFKTGGTVVDGAGTSNANHFEKDPVTPGVTGGAEVLVRFY